MLLDFPKANNVKGIPRSDDLLLVSVMANESIPATFEELHGELVAPVALERNKELLLPSGPIQEGDLIYLLGYPEGIRTLCSQLNTSATNAIKRVVLFEANFLGLQIAQQIAPKVELKIIDTDPIRCQRASELLQNQATIINAKYTEHTIFDEENLRRADMVIATSDDDEANIVKCLEAKEHGIPRTIAINNDPHYYDLMHKLSIVPIRGPKMGAYYAILERVASSKIAPQRHFCGGRGSLFVRQILPDSTLVGTKIAPPRFPARLFVVRDKLLDPGTTILQPGDRIILFCHSRYEQEAKPWIEGL